MNTGRAWWTLAVLLVLASAAKIIPVTLASKICSKRPWFYCLSIGVLMNTRGIVQLVVLNIGVSLGVISPLLFAIFVLMATILTFLTSPILYLLYRHDYDIRKLSISNIAQDLRDIREEEGSTDEKRESLGRLPTISNGDFINSTGKRHSAPYSKNYTHDTVVTLNGGTSHPNVGLNPMEIDTSFMDELDGIAPKTPRRSIVMTRF